MSIPRIFLLLPVLLIVACNSSEGEREKEGQAIESSPIEELSDQIIDDPNNPNLYIKRSLAYSNKGMYDLAMRDVQRALSVDSTVSYFHTVLGEIKFKQGQLRDARLSLTRAVQYDNTNTDALLKLGEVNFLLRRYEEALDYVNEALKIDDRLAQGYFIKGFVYKELGDTTLAISSFQTTTEVRPEHYEAFMELGNLYAFQGNPIAIEYFNTAIDLRPSSTEAYYAKGMFLQAGSKFEEAIATYREMLSADPNSFLGHYNLGYIYLTEYNKLDTALAYFDSVLTIQPAYVDAMYNRGLIYEERNREEEAIDIYRNVLAVDPQHDLAARGLERLLN